MQPLTQLSVCMFFTVVGNIKLYKYIYLVKKDKLQKYLTKTSRKNTKSRIKFPLEKKD